MVTINELFKTIKSSNICNLSIYYIINNTIEPTQKYWSKFCQNMGQLEKNIISGTYMYNNICSVAQLKMLLTKAIALISSLRGDPRYHLGAYLFILDNSIGNYHKSFN